MSPTLPAHTSSVTDDPSLRSVILMGWAPCTLACCIGALSVLRDSPRQILFDLLLWLAYSAAAIPFAWLLAFSWRARFRLPVGIAILASAAFLLAVVVTVPQYHIAAELGLIKPGPIWPALLIRMQGCWFLLLMFAAVYFGLGYGALARLGDFLRLTLAGDGRHEVTLAEEFDALASYLDIERTRLGDRLSVAIRAEDGVMACRVPWLMLQPLLENAIRHGVALRPEGGEVSVVASRQGGQLCVAVQSQGGWQEPPPDSDGERSIGLANVRARLARLYGDDGQPWLMPCVRSAVKRRPALRPAWQGAARNQTCGQSWLVWSQMSTRTTTLPWHAHAKRC
ncbi:MAG TPA: histidine kinase [Pinirhizobacter sp.]|uniref:sensor histidine kinase n=1 Tax=Pinirhizobacter sp. TaxID=2950432 RepID=UPI002BE46CAC|nr:histidine kinase [Pinirhizobacter sp.]HMH67028.1 histidine kinase [Pinirhizobacter sp.]